MSSRDILQSNYLSFIGFLTAFIALLVFLSIVSRLVEKMADAMLLGVANKLVGGLLEVAILVLILSTFIWYLDGLGAIAHDMTADSKSYPYLVKLPPAMFSFVSGFLPFFDMLNKSASGVTL